MISKTDWKTNLFEIQMIFVENNKQPIFTENGEKQQAAKLFSKWPPADAESKGLSANTGVAGAMIRGFFRLKHSMSSCLALHFSDGKNTTSAKNCKMAQTLLFDTLAAEKLED